MFWLIKKGFEHDPKYRELCFNLKKFDINHAFCNVIPFSDEFSELEIDLEEIKEPIFVYGSYNLSRIVKAKGYKPASFISDNLNLDNLLKYFGDEMFNYDMGFGTIDTIEPKLDEFFIRPIEDSKAFNAEVITKERFIEFKERISQLDEVYSTVNSKSMVAISKPKSIEQEIRFFIVDGKISTYSQYKLGKEVIYSPIVDQYIIDYVNKTLTIYQPDIVYCLDIAVSKGVPKILEINSINSAGLYAIDVQKFIFDIEELTKYFL